MESYYSRFPLPYERCKEWELFRFDLTDTQCEKLNPILFTNHGIWATHRPGPTVYLYKNGTYVASTNPLEVRLLNRQSRNLRVKSILLVGLGVGYLLWKLLQNPEIERIYVLEKQIAVTRLIEPKFRDDPRVTFFTGEAMYWIPPKTFKVDKVYFNIWTKTKSHRIYRTARFFNLTQYEFYILYKKFKKLIHSQTRANKGNVIGHTKNFFRLKKSTLLRYTQKRLNYRQKYAKK